MKKRLKPLKRHPKLIPLSRQHHQGLILAQLLKNDVPDYKGLPTTPSGKLEYTQALFEQTLFPHFKKEEEILIPMIKGYSSTLDSLSQQILSEHQTIKTLFDDLSQQDESELPDALDTLGRQIEAHIRFEERQFFPKIQQEVPEEILEKLTLD